MTDKLYTPEEVAAHNTWEDDDKSVWVVYGEYVYDVTKFIEDHPGGEEVVLDCAGDDMTVAFDNMGHSENAKKILEEYLIGKLVCKPCSGFPFRQKTCYWTSSNLFYLN